jgi:hypothetical protein
VNVCALSIESAESFGCPHIFRWWGVCVVWR